MDESEAERAPLARLGGAIPPAPAWFEAAMASAPERGLLAVGDGTIETLAWGTPGRPGLLLLHGSAAHADIWRPFAPALAQEHRVVAFSWPGMGGSSWRDSYALEEFADDILAVAEQSGLLAAGQPPIVIAHSLGGVPAVIAARRHGRRLGGVVVVDSPFRVPVEDKADRRFAAPERPHNIYPTLAAALARFRFAPTQPSPNLYLTDMIARASLEEVEGGWRWKFDPGVRKRMVRGDSWAALAAPSCPLAFVTGEHSKVVGAMMARTMEQAPPGTPHIVIPDAHHHLMVDQPIAFIAVLRAILAFWR